MSRITLLVFAVMLSFTHCVQSAKPEHKKEQVEPKKTAVQKDESTAEISVGRKKLVLTKKSDYDYNIKVLVAGKDIADTSVYTGFSPSQVYYDNNFFVMDIDIRNPSFIVYNAKDNSFKKYEGYWATTISFRIINEKLYIGYFAFDMQAGSLLVIDLNTGERNHFHNADGETIPSAEIKATEKGGKVYILMDYSSEPKVYTVETNGLVKVNNKVTDSFENKKLEELFNK
jgi:hypothetical protein